MLSYKKGIKNSQINEPHDNNKDQQTQEVEEFMNCYVKNTQWKQFLFNSLIVDTDQNKQLTEEC